MEASLKQRSKELNEQAKLHIGESVEAGAITPEAAKFIVDGLFRDDDFTYNAMAIAALKPLSDLGFDLTPIVLEIYEYRAENLEGQSADLFRVARQSLIVGRQDLPEHTAVIFISAASIDQAHDLLLQHGISATVIEEGADRALAFPEDQESQAWEAFETDPDSGDYIINYLPYQAAVHNTPPGTGSSESEEE